MTACHVVLEGDVASRDWLRGNVAAGNDVVNEKYKIVQSTSKFQNLLRIGMLVWGEADSETSPKRSL
ncbi:hypothetical protein Tco_0731866 [Tanacetum coccineum]